MQRENLLAELVSAQQVGCTLGLMKPGGGGVLKVTATMTDGGGLFFYEEFLVRWIHTRCRQSSIVFTEGATLLWFLAVMRRSACCLSAIGRTCSGSWLCQMASWV